MPLLEISLETAKGILTVAVILAGLALAMFIGAAAFYMAGKSWFRAAKGELTVPPEDDVPPPELIDLIGAEEQQEEEERAAH